MERYIFDENNGLWYELVGDYYLPKATVHEMDAGKIGVWGKKGRVKVMEMKTFVATLKEYIACEKPKPRADGAETLLEMLYDVYTEFDGIENDAIRKCFDELYTTMNGKTLQEMDEILDPVCTLCREHQKAGFEEGVKVGIRIATEVNLTN